MQRAITIIILLFCSIISVAQHITGFTQNKGQLTGVDANEVLYYYQSNSVTAHVRANGISYAFKNRLE
ncbi:MAG: hypothetical protein JKY53_10720 [Flavobacteriales bacterium]|nr:hypothetical protein [Flavobacteriales bacterium]